jgi:hypothetical protein
MVGCILGIEVSKHIGIRAVEGFDSGTNKLAMWHMHFNLWVKRLSQAVH